MALDVAECAVVGDHLEAVAQRLEAAAGPMAAVLALAHQLGDQGGALVRRQHPYGGQRLLLRDAAGLEEQRGKQLFLGALGREQPHRGRDALLPRPVEPEALGDPLGRCRRWLRY